MSVNREAIYQALFQRLKDKAGVYFATMGRKHIQPPALTFEMQPALFCVSGPENSSPRPIGTGGKLKLTAFLILYWPAPVTNDPPGQETDLSETKMNTLLGAVDDALAPDGPKQPWNPQNVQTLGGLVEHCWTEGDTDKDPGISTNQGFAVIPVSILVP